MDMDPVHKIGGAQQEKARRQIGSRQPRLRRKLMPKQGDAKAFTLGPSQTFAIANTTAEATFSAWYKAHTPDPRIQLTWMSLNTSEGSVRQFLR